MSVEAPMIAVAGVAKEFPGSRDKGPVRALTSVSFEVARGEIFGLLGSNGAGKSTLVQILSTLMRPSSGTARVAGFDVTEQDAEVRRRLGVALQETGLSELMTGRESLQHAARMWGLSAEESAARAEELLTTVGLADAADRLVRTYSGGMKRRLDLAIALAHRPEVLFLDEPTNGLDPRSRRQIWDYVRALSDSGVTVLLTTQYLEEADQLADRVAIIDQGRVVALDTPAELKRNHARTVLEVTFPDSRTARQAEAEILVEGEPGRVEGRTLSFAISDPSAAVPALVVDLHDRGLPTVELNVKEPTLDDVFLKLTGHRVIEREESGSDAEPAPPTAPEVRASAPADDTGRPRGASFPTQTWLLFRRLLREAVRNPAASAPNLLIGVFFLFVYDGLLGGSQLAQGVAGGNYANFLLPTILLFTSLSGGTAGLTLVEDIESGHLRRQLATPVSRSALISAFMALGALIVLLQSAIVTLLSLLLGLAPVTGLGGILVIFGLSLLWGLGIAGYSAATAMATGNAAAANAATLVFFPLLFISPALMPMEELKGWIAVASYANPATYLLEGMRGVLNTGWDPGQLLVATGVGLGFAALMLLWATATTRSATNRA